MGASCAAARSRLGQAATGLRTRATLPSVTGSGPASAASHLVGAGSREALVGALLAFAARQRSAQHGSTLDFTSSPEANELLRSDAFAFLIGVLFDQGVPYERAWLAPLLLRQRLGHLDPARIAVAESAVRDAIQAQPKLHRYIEKMPRWLVLAARRVMTEYGGDANAIWAGCPSADEVQQRFSAFVGIGQKKAAMAVEILERDRGVSIKNLERSDIAYDVHLRRVFLRTRLADRDDRDHMIAAARRLHPARPGALDWPAWQVGMEWCHAGIPDCISCPLTEVCPKDIERAAQVTSG